MFKPKSKNTKQKQIYAFIDSQNLNLGTQKVGWKMDWRKFRQYLRNKYGVTKAYMFIGYMPEFEDLYKQLHEAGYLIVLKPTQDLSKVQAEPTEGSNDASEEKKSIKGNIDADLVLWAMKEINNYSRAIIISGDGDFHSLAEYLISQNKLANLMVPNWQYSQLLREFDQYVIRLDRLRDQLAYRNRRAAKQKS